MAGWITGWLAECLGGSNKKSTKRKSGRRATGGGRDGWLDGWRATGGGRASGGVEPPKQTGVKKSMEKVFTLFEPKTTANHGQNFSHFFSLNFSLRF